MLAFDERKRPTVAQILQMRFIRDRIKIFLQKQRPNSGKKSRPVSGGKRPGSGEKKPKPIEQDFDTLKVEVIFSLIRLSRMGVEAISHLRLIYSLYIRYPKGQKLV